MGPALKLFFNGSSIIIKTMRKVSCLLVFLILFPLIVSSTIIKLTIDGPIDSITQEYVNDHFEKIADRGDLKLVIIEIDTPGGFDTSMRAIIKNILNSPVPVAVLVSPRGARAASDTKGTRDTGN